MGIEVLLIESVGHKCVARIQESVCTLAQGESGGNVNQRTAAQLTEFLESNWCEEFSESLSEQHDAALGFALARAVCRGWVEASDAMDSNFRAAADFMGSIGDEA